MKVVRSRAANKGSVNAHGRPVSVWRDCRASWEVLIASVTNLRRGKGRNDRYVAMVSDAIDCLRGDLFRRRKVAMLIELINGTTNTWAYYRKEKLRDRVLWILSSKA